MPWIAGAILGGGALMAGGSLAGGFLGAEGGLSSGDMILPSYDPSSNFPVQASTFDSLQGIGFARPDLLLQSGPLNELVGRINASQLDEKIKRRALIELNLIATGQESAGGERYPRELQDALGRMGLNASDIPTLVDRQKQYDASIQPLMEKLGFTQDDIIANRLATARAISEGNLASGEQLAAAAGFARGGVPQNALQRALLDRDNRATADIQDRLGVLANFGNINPATMFDTLIDRELDQNLRLLQQSLSASGLLAQGAGQTQGASQGATANAQASASQGAAIQQNAAGLAASQAQAANQLRQQASLDNALSIANGVNGSTQAMGSALMGFGSYSLGQQQLANQQQQFDAWLNRAYPIV